MGLAQPAAPTSAWPGSRLDRAGVVQLVSQLARGRVNETTMAATAPIAPPTAMTRPGANHSAAAPARIMAVPCPRLIPPWAIPNAWLRWDGGVACTNVALAAT